MVEELTIWEMLVLNSMVVLAKKTENHIVTRTEIQRKQPDLAKLLKEHVGYKIGKTPENTVDAVIQDLEKKGFIEMLFRHGGKRGQYKINVTKAEEAVKAFLVTILPVKDNTK
jgi:DNA-binding PadR family transcriptional regulator